MIHVSQLGDDFFVFDQASQSLIGQARGQSFSLGDEVKIKVAAVNLEDRKIDFELMQQLTRAGLVLFVCAHRAWQNRSAVKPLKKFFLSVPSKATLSENGEQPVPKKKPKKQN